MKTIICVIIICVIVVPSQGQSDIPVVALGWSSDGSRLAVVTSANPKPGEISAGESVVYLFDNDGQLVDIFIIEGRTIRIAWNPDSSKIAFLLSLQVHYAIRIIDMTSFRITADISELGAGTTSSLEWNYDGTLIATDRPSRSVWSALTGKFVAELNPGTVINLAWYPNSNNLLISTTSTDGYVLEKWDGQHNHLIQTVKIEGMDHPIEAISFKPDGTQVAIGSSSGKLAIPDTADFSPIITPFDSSLMRVFYVEWSPDGKEIAAASFDSDILIFDAENGELLDSIIKTSYGYLESLAYSPYAGRIAFASDPSYYSDIPTTPPLRRSFHKTLLNGAVEIVVPVPSLEKLKNVAAMCDYEASIVTIEGLPDFIVQIVALPEGAIPAGCAADLIAVAEAIIGQ